MNPKSPEQQIIVNNIKNNNIVVNAVPGSGKTTTCLHIAIDYEYNILLLVYNARLKLDTRKKISDLNLTNIESHSFHSFCKSYYNTTTINDKGLVKIIDNDIKPIKEFKYDLIIIDEAQDLNNDFYKLSLKIIKDNNIKNPRLLIVGDINQAIYEFRKSNTDYLINPMHYFNGEWQELYLTTSFRITKEMADLVNNSISPHIERKIQTIKSGVKPQYIITPTNKTHTSNRVCTLIMELLETYNYDDIFVLTSSTKTTKHSKYKPITNIDKFLAKQKIPVFIKTTDDDKVSDKLMENKISLLTMHQSKGLERKIVILCGFDSSYYKYYGKDENKEIAPNIFYVASTRAQEKLYIIHHNTNDYLPFLDTNTLNNYCEIDGVPKIRRKKKELKKINYTKSVTGITTNLSQRVMNKLLEFVDTEIVSEKDSVIVLPHMYKNNKLNTSEDITTLNGSAIPAYFELQHTEKISGLPKVKPNTSIGHIMKLINTQEAKRKDLYSPKCQIKEFNWININVLNKCMDRMNEKIVLNKDCKFEHHVCKDNIEGRIDLLNGDEIWEFKCVSNLDDSHIIQTVLYQYLLGKENTTGYLFNILTNEIIKIKLNNYNEFIKLLKK